MGIVKRSGKNAFPPHRILLNPVTWPVVGTYGSWGFFVTTINPPGISWQCPFDDRKLLEADWTKSCVLIMKGVARSLWTAMTHSITVGYKILQCLPGDKWTFVQKKWWVMLFISHIAWHWTNHKFEWSIEKVAPSSGGNLRCNLRKANKEEIQAAICSKTRKMFRFQYYHLSSVMLSVWH